MVYLGTIVGFTAGNFIYQALTAQDWVAATDRSFFQTAAILGVAVVFTARRLSA